MKGFMDLVQKIDKKLVAYVCVSLLLGGLIGFYGGRYYERTTFRSQMTKNRGTQNGTTGIQRSGSANGTGGEMMMPPMDGTGPRESGQRPTQTTTETKTE